MGKGRVSKDLNTTLIAVHVSSRHNHFDSFILYPGMQQASLHSEQTKQKTGKKAFIAVLSKNIEFILKQPCQPCILCLLYIFVVKFNYSV